MPLSWTELVCHCLLKKIGERGVVCRILDLVRPIGRKHDEDDARKYHAKQYLEHVVIHPWSSQSLFKFNYYELKKEFKDAWMGRDPFCGERGVIFIHGQLVVAEQHCRKTAVLWPSDICLDVVKRGRERRESKERRVELRILAIASREEWLRSRVILPLDMT